MILPKTDEQWAEEMVAIIRRVRAEWSTTVEADIPKGLTLKELESWYIEKVIDRHDGDLTAAARTLGIARTTLWRRKRRPSSA